MVQVTLHEMLFSIFAAPKKTYATLCCWLFSVSLDFSCLDARGKETKKNLRRFGYVVHAKSTATSICRSSSRP